MKAILETATTTAGYTEAAASEWSWRTIVKIALATAVLVAVYLVTSWLPTEPEAFSSTVFSGLALFWVMGGVFTITLLALSDKRG